jgi:Uma2 family endonuclease
MDAERDRLWQELNSRGHRAEIAGGRIIVSPGAQRRHCKLIDRVCRQLAAVTWEQGWEFYQNWAVHIPPHRGDKRLPDLLVAPPDSPEFDECQAFGYGTLLAVEVCSKESRHDDLEVKPGEYARAGVPMLLVVDDFAEPKTVTLFHALRDDAYRICVEVAAGEILELPEPFGVKLDTEALFREP